MEPSYTITKARPEHLGALPDIELAAATMFEGYVPASVPQDKMPQSKFRSAQREGRLWLALFGETPVGFALVEMLAEDLPHSRRSMLLRLMAVVGSEVLWCTLFWSGE